MLDRARKLVRKACRELGIRSLATHGYRKTFSVEEYHRARSRSAYDREALLDEILLLAGLPPLGRSARWEYRRHQVFKDG